MAKDLTANVRMYQVGELGDCFLLTFIEDADEVNVLIDCGSFRNSSKSQERLSAIVKNIKSKLNGKKLDVVVGTHQHNDHVSGFVHCKELFKNNIKQVWLSWLDDPKSALARRVNDDQKKLLGQLQAIHAQIARLNVKGDYSPVKDILGFYGVDAPGSAVPAEGIANLKILGDEKVDYLTPGEIKRLPGIGVNVYVLGPPRNMRLLFDKDPDKDETYDPALALANKDAEKLLSALRAKVGSADKQEEQFPFNKVYKKTESKADQEIVRVYNNHLNSWQKIDADWLNQANRLALFLDSFTNNGSLALAFELVKSGKVLLFAADAQVGNWLSWQDIKWPVKNMTTNDLLTNTVLYKVGHHASHNGTLKKALETMKHEELVAMIPVDKSDPNITKKNGWKMPAKNLFQRLKEKTHFRVLTMDDGFADGCNPVKDKPKSKWNELPFKPKIDKKNFFVEYKIQG
ncbi:MBL fold metallo-hydrolase [Danxiaibacter flavus]|uniref:MBL fold metallo-hydrolase n=1 Tax=Danxiaibacter flavus TaxID=3049108 RepID=A0ABV3ZDB2_9BACT|nr:MBL fold metallo-hydrolase [Chitinophagaceae bacterium DXS]